MPAYEPLKIRFWRKVQKSERPGECWLWAGNIAWNGYGHVGAERERKIRTAHRVAWELVNGKIPEEMCVCHRCDVRHCVNPEHLFLATQSENLKDMYRKGRNRNPPMRGERNGNSRLVASQVRIIRKEFAEGHTKRGLARKFNVNPTTIYHIVTNKSWRHVLPCG